MKIHKKFYTGPFCNPPINHEEEIVFYENPVNDEFLNPDYPYLNRFFQIAYCIGISLWKIEMNTEYVSGLNREEVHQLITSSDILEFQLWKANGNTGTIKEKKAPVRKDLIKTLATNLFYMQPHGNPKPEFSRKICKSLANEFLDSLETDSGKIIQAFHIEYGWSNWFASDCHDYGILIITEKAIWLLAISESD